MLVWRTRWHVLGLLLCSELDAMYIQETGLLSAGTLAGLPYRVCVGPPTLELGWPPSSTTTVPSQSPPLP